MDHIQLCWVSRCVHCLGDDLIGDEVAWDEVKNRLHADVQVVEHSKCDHHELEAAR